MIELLGRYLAQDRLRALASGLDLPKRASGCALLADIHGFTPLTEKLAQQYGPRHGIDLLTHKINKVYSALIDEVERYGGSVVTFAGDAITCWFDDLEGQSSARAAACAQAMQAAMQTFPETSLKIAVCLGAVCRFVVGEPGLRLFDTLAGQTITRLTTAEHLAGPAEILLDEACAASLDCAIREWRSADNNERYAVLASSHQEVTLLPGGPAGLPGPLLDPETLRPWLVPVIYQRERQGHGLFLTELRPTVALFVRFMGIHYDEDPQAEQKLSQVVCKTLVILQKYDGVLLELMIGDKGSYFYVSFGAVLAHEDDPRRAVRAALEIDRCLAGLPFLSSHQAGLSSGTMRTGAYGSPTRQSYSALGDEVNLAARLMMKAISGEILISRRVQKSLADDFSVEPRPPLLVKGKAEPLPVFSVTGLHQARPARLPEPSYRLPMVGRQAELARVDEVLSRALQGSGQVLGIVAEAGLGKSRLVAEIIRLAHKRGFVGYGGGCQSSGQQTPYLVWHSIWQALFDLDPEATFKKQLRILETELEERVPHRMPALPLLSLVLNLALPDNDFTRMLEPRDRKGALEALLADCLSAEASETPLLIIIEDLHWIDPLSLDLLESLVRVCVNLPVCFVVAYRPPEGDGRHKLALENLDCFSKIELKELDAGEVELLIRAKLAQLFPEMSAALPRALSDHLTVQAQGNPFFIEEVLNYLHDRGLNPFDANALQSLELPASLQSLILSRIDQLTELQKVTLKVASVIGRVFPFSWLHGFYPGLGDESSLRINLEELARLDLTPLDVPDPELAYLFKHIITQEVAYESLIFATRTRLHELLAQYLEQNQTSVIPLETITYHYSRSDNLLKKREYLQRAGTAAQQVYSNAAAQAYFEQALATSPEPVEFVVLNLKLGATLQLVGRLDEARLNFLAALRVAEENHFVTQVIQAYIQLGGWHELRAEYPSALEWFEKAHSLALQQNDQAGICSALSELGGVYWRMGNFDQAHQFTASALALARQLADQKSEVDALLMAAAINGEQGNYIDSHKAFAAALVISRDLNDKRRSATIFSNSGTIYYFEGNYPVAKGFWEKGLSFYRDIGDRRSVTLIYNNLGNIHYLNNDFESAKKCYTDSLVEGRTADDKYAMAISFAALGITCFRQGLFDEAQDHYQHSLVLASGLNYKVGLALLHCYLGLLALARRQVAVAQACFSEGLQVAYQAEIKSYAIYNLIGFAMLALQAGDPARGLRLLAAANALAVAIGLKIEPELQIPYEQVLQAARQALPESEFENLWQAGASSSLDEAVNQALTIGPGR